MHQSTTQLRLKNVFVVYRTCSSCNLVISNKYNSVSQQVLDAFDEHRGDLSSVYFSTAFLDVIKHLNHPLHGQLMALPKWL